MIDYLADLHLKPTTIGVHRGKYYSGISLLEGWFPYLIESIVIACVIITLIRRTKRWYLTALPLAIAVGVTLPLAVRYYCQFSGLMNNPAPLSLWIWLGVFGTAFAIIILGWKRSGWLHRGWTFIATLISAFAILLSFNQWVGYYPDTASAWQAITAGPLPDEIDLEDLASYEGKGSSMTRGVVVAIDSPSDYSRFIHREEYVYLPPAYFTVDKPSLPVILMIGGEFNTPADWLRSGGAINVIDDYVRDHRGQAPILSFVDVSGTFNNDTECVDGIRGNAATHINQEFRPFIIDNYRASANPKDWAVIGWSMGGTCAINLGVTHPELYGTFVDILGDPSPNAGTDQQTLDRLYGGDHNQMDKFDPFKQLLLHKGQYSYSQGVIYTSAISQKIQALIKDHVKKHTSEMSNPGFGGKDDVFFNPDQFDIMPKLCPASKSVNLNCISITLPMGHNWQIAKYEFYNCLPWIAARFNLPESSRQGIN